MMMVMKKNNVDADPSPVPTTTKNASPLTRRNVSERRINVCGPNVRRRLHCHPSNHQQRHRKVATPMITRTVCRKVSVTMPPFNHAQQSGYPMEVNKIVKHFGMNARIPTIVVDPLHVSVTVRIPYAFLDKVKK